MTTGTGGDQADSVVRRVAESPGRSWLQSRWLVLLGLLVLALNLRPAAVAVGPLLKDISSGLAMSGPVAGLLTSMPVLCFAGFGFLAPGIASRIGIHRVLCLALVLAVIGQLARAMTTSIVVFLAATAVALSGVAVANVLLPSLVKLHFGHRIGLVTAMYTTVMTIGLTAASMLTVPIAQALDGWRWGLGIWASTAIIAILPWLPLINHDRIAAVRAAELTDLGPPKLRVAVVARTRLGWVMAIFFGIQSSHAYTIFGWLPSIYQAAGYSATAAGFYLGIATGVGIPLAFLFPAYAARTGRPYGLMVLIGGSLMIGYLGLLLAPGHLPWLWAIFLAIGSGSFPVILTLLGLRARTSDGTAALSGFTQSVGYLIAIPGPLLVGVLHDLTGGWTVPTAFLAAMAIPFLVFGLLTARPRFLEDEITSH